MKLINAEVFYVYVSDLHRFVNRMGKLFRDELPFFSSRTLFSWCAIFGTLERKQKSRCLHQEQRPSPGDFVREYLFPRIG